MMLNLLSLQSVEFLKRIFSRSLNHVLDVYTINRFWTSDKEKVILVFSPCDVRLSQSLRVRISSR